MLNFLRRLFGGQPNSNEVKKTHVQPPSTVEPKASSQPPKDLRLSQPKQISIGSTTQEALKSTNGLFQLTNRIENVVGLEEDGPGSELALAKDESLLIALTELGTIVVFDRETNLELARTRIDGGMVVANNGRHLVSCCESKEGGVIRVHRLPDLSISKEIPISKFNYNLAAIDQDLIIAAWDGIQIVNLLTCRVEHSIGDPDENPWTVEASVFQPRLYAGSTKLMVWDIESTPQPVEFINHQGFVYTISESESFIATGTSQGELRVFGREDLGLRKQISIQENDSPVAVWNVKVLEAQGELIVHAGEQLLQVLDLETLEVKDSLFGHKFAEAMTVSSNGQNIITGCWQHTIETWSRID